MFATSPNKWGRKPFAAGGFMARLEEFDQLPGQAATSCQPKDHDPSVHGTAKALRSAETAALGFADFHHPRIVAAAGCLENRLGAVQPAVKKPRGLVSGRQAGIKRVPFSEELSEQDIPSRVSR